MVISLILNVIGSVLTWLLGLLPTLPVPSWLTSVGSFLSTVSSSLSASSAWLPWTYLLLAVALVIGAYVVAVAIRGLRIVGSFLTLGGGS